MMRWFHMSKKEALLLPVGESKDYIDMYAVDMGVARIINKVRNFDDVLALE